MLDSFGASPEMSSSSTKREVGLLGGEDFILSQKSGVEEELFKGKLLGVDADISQMSFRVSDGRRSLDHIKGDYYIPPAFMDAFTLHLAKNYLYDSIKGKVPLMLGIWGHKGCGKSFNLELCCKKMGVVPIMVSAGELEDEEAGRPGLIMRERYRTASDLIRKQGVMACMIINDLDAGVARFTGRQYTVNNQIVQGTLMNLCDNPHSVSVGQEYREEDTCARVPIFITANDLSKVYAPLVRDGRMSKFFWQPTEEDLIAMTARLFSDDNVPVSDVEELVRAFPGQALDFFGAVRARLVDDSVREWVGRVGHEELASALLGGGAWFDREAIDLGVTAADFSLPAMMAAGRGLEREQRSVMESNLAVEYMPPEDPGLTPEPIKRKATPPPPTVSPLQQARIRKAKEEAEAALERSNARRTDEEREAAAIVIKATVAPEPERKVGEGKEWDCVDIMRAKEMVDREGYAYVDVRSARAFDNERFKRAVNIPAEEILGRGLNPKVEAREDWLGDFKAKYPDKAAKVLIVGGAAGEPGPRCMEALREAGYTGAVEMEGGFEAWSPVFRVDGTPRCRGKWGDPTMPAELEMWTASN